MNNCTNMNEYKKMQRSEAVITRVERGTDRFLDLLCALIDTVLTFFAKTEVRRAIRAAVVTVCLFCFIGLIGGIEKGLLSVGAGIVCGLGLIGVEIFCLR